MIRFDAVWLSTEPLDMRAGIDSALARVVKVFGGAQVLVAKYSDHLPLYRQ